MKRFAVGALSILALAGLGAVFSTWHAPRPSGTSEAQIANSAADVEAPAMIARNPDAGPGGSGHTERKPAVLRAERVALDLEPFSRDEYVGARTGSADFFAPQRFPDPLASVHGVLRWSRDCAARL